jgi:hypothetical protein
MKDGACSFMAQDIWYRPESGLKGVKVNKKLMHIAFKSQSVLSGRHEK